MRIFNFSSLSFRIIFASLFFLLFLLALFSYTFNQIFILFVCFSIISRLIYNIKLNRGILRGVLIALILLVSLWATYNLSPRINFWLTSSARQSVVDRVISDNAIRGKQEQEIVLKNNIVETVLLGKATAYINQNHYSVYFNYYKRFQAAFFIYTSDPASIDARFIQLKRLKNNWFFLLRSYA